MILTRDMIHTLAKFTNKNKQLPTPRKLHFMQIEPNAIQFEYACVADYMYMKKLKITNIENKKR